MTYNFDILTIGTVGFGIAAWFASPIRQKLFINQFRDKENRSRIKEVMDEIYKLELEEHREMVETIKRLNNSSEENSRLLTRIAETLQEQGRTVQETCENVAFISGMLERRKEPRE